MTIEPTERRRHVRTPVRQLALAVLSGGVHRLETTIVDASVSGAKLELDDAAELPSLFYMLLPMHRLQPCRLVWQSGQYAGVSYEG